jgi:polysaccharide export outer membrane protein
MFPWSRIFALRTLRVSLLVLPCLPLFAQLPVQETQPPVQNPEPPVQASPAPQLPASSSTRLDSGDLLEVNVFGVPDLSTKVRISNSGAVYLPLIDYVHVAGLTVDEAQELIEKRLEDGGFVRSPHVSIFVNESASQAVSILGEVSHPGPYPSVGEPRLYDLISAAGGLTEKAGRSVTIVHRSNPDQKIELRLPSNLAEDTTPNVEIQPGDTIIVSRAGIIYVVGDVQHPSGFIIQDNTLTVLKALALAGGGTRTSSLNGSKILRETSNGTQEIPVHLKSILHAKSPDVALAKGDILFVPGSAAKSVGYRSAEAAATLTTALTLVAVRP